MIKNNIRPKTPLEMIFALAGAVKEMSEAKNYIEFQNSVSVYETMKGYAYAVLPLGTVEKVIHEFDTIAIDASNKYLMRVLN